MNWGESDDVARSPAMSSSPTCLIPWTVTWTASCRDHYCPLRIREQWEELAFQVPGAQFTAGEVNAPGAWGAGMSSKMLAIQGVLVEPTPVSSHMWDNYFCSSYTLLVSSKPAVS